MTPFLTVKEAARQTGRSPSSIRRLIYPILHDDQHPERSHIQPSIEDVRELRSRGESFAWLVSEEFLLKQVPTQAALKKGTDTPDRITSAAEAELIGMLHRELEIKNQQIATHIEEQKRLHVVIDNLNDRLKESNFLMGSLQQQLALGDGRRSVPAEPTKAKRSPSQRPEKGGTTATKPSKPKRGLFARLFRSP